MDVNECPNSSSSPLIAACQQGNTDIAELWLTHGTNVDLAITDGMTALIMACQHDRIDVIELLLRHHASVNMIRVDGSTALMTACQSSHYNVVKLLLKHGVSVNIVTNDEWTALMLVCQSGFADLTQLLLNHGARHDMAKHDGATALMIASHSGHNDVAALLLKHVNDAMNGANLGREGSDVLGDCNIVSLQVGTANGETALMVALDAGQFDLAKKLIDAGASVHVRSVLGETPFTAAARLSRWEMITTLGKLGYSALQDSASLQASLIPSTLHTAITYGQHAHEFQSMWSSVMDRMSSIYAHFEEDESLSKSAFLQYLMILARFIRIRSKCEAKSIFTRLVVSRSVMSSIEDVHAEINYLLRGAEFVDCEATASN